MQPDKTLIQLVTWINIIEAENAKLVAALRQYQERDKKAAAVPKMPVVPPSEPSVSPGSPRLTDLKPSKRKREPKPASEK